jgi:ribosomal protein S18 acetylase RimI-like enzyme
MAAKLADLIEGGLNPEQIIQHFKNADEEKAINDKEWDDVEVFPDEIHIISQALAYREATLDDAKELHALLCSAYKPEIEGSESFRQGEVVSESVVHTLLHDATYKWLLVEAPSGKNIERDGVILGAACFSTDGVSRKNGVVEGQLGSIRFLAVLPRYHGFCVGRRLLERAEEAMFKNNCCKVMACIPTTRVSAMEWVDRRGYTEAGSIPYPATGLDHVLKDNIEDMGLVRFVKAKPSPEASTAGSTKPSGTWHLRNKPSRSHASAPAPTAESTLRVTSQKHEEEEEDDDEELLGVD